MSDQVHPRPGAIDPTKREALLQWLRGDTADDGTLAEFARAYLESKLPFRAGEVIETRGRVKESVSIRRDRWGIAHLRAASEADLFFGLGYAMAQERLWQLDYQRRLVRGELAAVLGPRYLPSDRELRTLGMGAAGERAWEAAPEVVRTALEALAGGINRGTEEAMGNLPLEFELLGYEPRPWHPADSVAIWKHRWWTLTGRLDLIVLADYARKTLPPDLASAFFDVELADETIVESAEYHARGNPGAALNEGSNNWVVGGGKTTTGAPVLCSDPHNVFAAPSQWFETHLSCPTIEAAGAIYLGTIGLYLGRNRDVAWGLTNHMISVRDLYREDTGADHPGQYRDGETWRPFETDRQVIAVAGGADETLEIRRTIRGPIVNHLLPTVDTLDAPVSLRWLGAEVPSGLDASLGLLRARSADDVLTALRNWPCPPLNYVYADAIGNIGYHAAGRVPWRARGGIRLRDANDPDDRWDGFYPFDAMPRVANPARGWVATANNVPGSPDPWYLESGAWSDGYRAREIRERLTAKDKLAPEEIAAVHGDVTSIRARDLVPALLDHVAELAAPLAPAARQALRGWDFRYTTDSVGASVWTAFWVEWCRTIAQAHFPAVLQETASLKVGAIARRLLLGETLGWLDGNPAEAIRAAFQTALAALEAWGGANPDGWQWGKLHQLSHPHPLAFTPALRALYQPGPFPTSGGATVRAAGHGSRVPFTVTSGSTYRFLADLSRPDALFTVQTLGQSANPASPHFQDQIPLWLENRYHPLWMNEADIEANTESEVRVGPG
ncbi:MAG TPA: penicillin acylase family protein [Chloroflexota bacterium]|nr:penicillin acylase family protein [Chloroflexota bacterium]